MSRLIEQLGTLRSMGIDGDEKGLQLLLRNAGYNIERAINDYFERGLPARPPSSRSSPAQPMAMVTPSKASPSLTPSSTVANHAMPKCISSNGQARGGATGFLAMNSSTGEMRRQQQQQQPTQLADWPKFVGEKCVMGYSLRLGKMAYREPVAIIHSSTGIGGTDVKKKGREKAAVATQGKRGRSSGTSGSGTGRQYGRPSSAGAMCNILFRGTLSGVEGRLPIDVCTFLAPLLRAGLARAHAEVMCELTGLNTFADVPLLLSIEIHEGLFALDPGEDEELYRSAYSLLQFSHTGRIEQEQPKAPPQQSPTQSQTSPKVMRNDGDRVAGKGGADRDDGDTSRLAGASAAAEVGEVGLESNEGEKEVRDEDVKQLYDDEAQMCNMPESPDPRLFVEGLSLRRYQRQALAWMIERERRRYVTEEDCTGLSLVSDPKEGDVASASSSGHGFVEPEDGKTREAVGIKDGVVCVMSWDAAGGNVGGGDGAVIHPLWERRAAASMTRSSSVKASPFSGSSIFSGTEGEGAEGGEDATRRVFSRAEAFFVNVYSRQFQREFPPASLGCRGGILADEMGMGKTVMLLSLILADKEQQQEKQRQQEGGQNRTDESTTAGAAAAATGGNDEDLIQFSVVKEGGGDNPTAPTKRVLGNTQREQQEPASPEGQPDTSDAHEAEGKSRGSRSGRGGRRKRHAPTPTLASSDHEALSAKRRRTRSRAVAATGTSEQCFHDEQYAGAGVECHGSAGDDAILLVSEASSSRGEGSGLDESDGSSDGSKSDYVPMSAGSEQGKEDESESNDDVDNDDSGSDYEPPEQGNTAREDWIRSPRKKKKKHKISLAAGRKKCAAGRHTKGTGGRWGGGKAGSDLSTLLVDPYANAGGKCPWMGMKPKEGGKEDEGGVEVVLCDSGFTGQSGGGEGRRRDVTEGGTLVVCPLSLIGQWRGELESKTRNGALSVSFYYGSTKNRSTRELCSFDVVLTTYGTVSSELMKKEANCQAAAGTGGSLAGRGIPGEKKRPRTGLLGVRWRRVILDEAHSIRNINTDQSRACLELEASRRWAVTGTPIQNSLDDAAALLAFLRHEPWSDRGWWRRVIGDPYKTGDMEAIRRLKAVLAPIMLRRTKGTLDSSGRPIVDLPPKDVEIVRLEFTGVEREFYKELKQRSQLEFEGYVAAGTVMNSYIAILTLLLRLRQACNHPFLVLGRDQQQKTVALQAITATEEDRPVREISASGATVADDREAGHSGTAPRYVQELYKRFQARVVAEAHKGESGCGPAGPATAVVKGHEGREGEAAGCAGSISKAFIDSVVGQLTGEREAASGECPVCLEEPMDIPVLTPCAHRLCRHCLEDCLRREACCPVCRTDMEVADIIPMSEQQERPATTAPPPKTREERADGVKKAGVAAGGGRVRVGGERGRADTKVGDWVDSTKLSRLEFELREMKRKRTGAKAVVFSQWTHMLDLAEASLARGDWKVRRLDGSMTQQRRESALKSFATDATVTVMLVSLKAGGVGLNLTAASTVILLDPWWNPAVEDQAIDRIHRLGQLNEVSVKRFVVTGTVEDKMLALQEVKGRMARNALASGSVGENSKLRVEDLMQFFN